MTSGFKLTIWAKFYLKKAEDVLADGIAKNSLWKAKVGSLFSMGEDETCLDSKSDGTTLYLTRDVAD